MRLGPLEVTWSRPELSEDQVRSHLVRLLDQDRVVRGIIGRCARSVARDYLDEQREVAVIGQKVAIGEPVSDAEMNLYNLYRA